MKYFWEKLKKTLLDGGACTISQMRILDIVKMLFLPNLIHGFIELPIKIPQDISSYLQADS